MEFNWEEFKASDKISVHCKTEEEAIDFCKHMHEHGMEWNSGESYLDETNWNQHMKGQCYASYGAYSSVKYFTKNNCTILEWSDYEKENNMNLELNNLTDEQKKQIIELAKKFEQENEVDKLDMETDYRVVRGGKTLGTTCGMSLEYAQDHFILGLTAHTKEEAEKIRRRLLVEKELRDWAKKCKEPVDIKNRCQEKFILIYDMDSNRAITTWYNSLAYSNIIFTDGKTINQAIESIGQERLIRDYFGIDK